MRLNNKIALIAGAGGRQGTTVPLIFAREGARVVLCGLDGDELERLAATINGTGNTNGGAAAARATNLTDPAEAEAAVRFAVDTYGGLDILYNNTGIYTHGDDRAADTDVDAWRQLLQVNLESHFLTMKYALPELVKRGGGSIINVAAARPARLGGNVAYGASKAAIIGMTKKIAKEYAEQNVRANCICPTNIQASPAQMDAAPPARRIVRDGTPEDVAYAALFLASDESAWITGTTLVVDGGAEVLG